MKRITLSILIVLVLSGVFYSIASADFPPPPEDDSCCNNGWWELYYIPNAKYCNGGDYYIWHCREKDSKDVLYTSVCLSSIQSPEEINTVYIPYMVKE